MKKQLHQPKGKHVLSVLRKIIGATVPETKAVLGLSRDTVKSISSGRLAFSERAARTVAAKTGVSIAWLLAMDASKPPTTEGGEPFTEETFNRHEMQHDKFTLTLPASKKRGDETFRLYYLLCVKLGRVLLAAHEGTPAQPEGDTRFAAWKLRDEMIKLGNHYPTFDTNKKVYSGLIEMRSIPETFDNDLQTLMGSGKAKPVDVWRSVIKRFHRDLATMEKQQAVAAT